MILRTVRLFKRDNTRTLERRNDYLFFYSGIFSIDEDFIYDEVLFAKENSGVFAFYVSGLQNQTGFSILNQPYADVISNNKKYTVPVKCVIVDGKEIEFEEEGLNGCLMLVNDLRGGSILPYQALIYLSPKVKSTQFAQLYLLNRESPNFKIVYDDSDNVELIALNVLLIGPLKIWEINYPDDLEPSPYYYSNELPDANVINP